MRLAFFVLDVATEIDEYTTTRLARAAVQGGHEVWYVGLETSSMGNTMSSSRPGHIAQSSRKATRSKVS
jgi:glutathione synthase